MAIKIYCDQCKAEVMNGLVSEFRTVLMDSKAKLLMGKKEEIKQGVFMLCSNCALSLQNQIINESKKYG